MKIKHLVACAALACIGAIQATAIPYDVNTQGTYLGLTAGNTPNDFFYKQDNGGAESGDGAASIQTVFSNGGLTATLTWTGDQPILSIFYLKAASEYVSWNIANFNDAVYDSIVVQNTGLILNANGGSQSISHIQLEAGVRNVPDGGSMLAMLGVGVTVLGLIRRKIAA